MHKSNSVQRENKPVSPMYPDYQYHLSESVINLADKRMMGTLYIEGMAFESESDAVIENAFNDVKNYLVGVGKEGDMYLWTHLVKEKVCLDDEYHFKNNFLARFTKQYLRQFKGENFYKCSYYMTFGIPAADINTGIERLEGILYQACAVLKPFGASVLGVEGEYISEPADYFSVLLNKRHNKIPLSSSPLSMSVPDSDWYWGNDTLELRNNESDGKVFATNYVVKDFPMFTKPSQWDFLLRLPYEFVLTQSFIFESPTKTTRAIDSQLNKLTSSGDSGLTQMEELELGKEVVTSGDTLFGSYHCVLSVFGDTPDEARKNGMKVAGEFVTTGKGFRFIRATGGASCYVFFSHMPLNKKRPLDTRRTLTNLACTFSMHNFSSGKRYGNPIGDGTAIMPLKTTSEGLYHYNTHYSEPHRNVTGKMMAGHNLILGASETGKTTFEGTAAGWLQRFNPNMFVVDFNRSTELFVRAYGGSYFALKAGEYSGLVPWQLADADDPVIGKDLVAFLREWVKTLAYDHAGHPPTDAETDELSHAVDMIMKLPRDMRRTGALLDYVTPGSELEIRLRKWCGTGDYAWAADSPRNTFDPMDKANRKVGFDTTVILQKINNNIHPACQPVLAILFFYKKLMQRDGELMLSIIEEFWMPANFPLTQEMILASLKAGRMQGEMMWLTSQSPEDAINCAIFATLIQQTTTKTLLPNPDALWEGYKQIGLTEKEFKKLKALRKDSRTMLVKQSGSSCFVKMDLYGFDEFLPVISGTTKGLAIFDQLMTELETDDPDIWIPEFIKRVNSDD